MYKTKLEFSIERQGCDSVVMAVVGKQSGPIRNFGMRHNDAEDYAAWAEDYMSIKATRELIRDYNPKQHFKVVSINGGHITLRQHE